MKAKYDITQDILYINFIRSKPQLSEASIIQYKTTLSKFCESTQQTLQTIINTCKEQQNKVTETIQSKTITGNKEIIEKSITKYDVNDPDSYINIYLNTHIQFCKSRENSNITINHDLSLIGAFLGYYNVEMPKLEKYKRDTKKWYLLSKEDFKFVINDSSLTHASLIKFLMSSGMRIKDALSLTIGDFMEATQEYHHYNDIDEFINNAPQDMMGSWNFHPHKTQRFNIECQTFNDPESSNLILQNLRKIKNEYIPTKNKKQNLELTLNKSDALFGSARSNFKGHIPPHSLSDSFWRKNQKLRKHHINLIQERINAGELPVEDYDKEVSKIPKFHAHGCRKYFQTAISKNCGDLRICTLMEGHISPVKTDSSYIKKEIDEVKEAYMAALHDLSLEKTETKVYTSEVRREMEEKINMLEKELEAKTSEATLMDDRLSAIEEMIYSNDNLVNVVDKFKK